MKIRIENLGVLGQAEFELGPLTLICGDNNSGKTYATYALFGFLSNWSVFLSVDIPESTIDELVKNGVARLDVDSYAKQLQEVLWQGSERYMRMLPTRVFSSKSKRFEQTIFRVDLDEHMLSSAKSREFRFGMGMEHNATLSLTKDEGDSTLVTTLLRSKVEELPVDTIEFVISYALKHMFLDDVFPRPFIASTERTGVAMFRSELVSSRNRQRPFEDGTYQQELFLGERLDYPLPVEVNTDFIRRIEKTTKEDSFLARDHPEVLAEFSDIIGGEYDVTESDTICFLTADHKLPLTMDESSSAVRSLLIVGLYLRHVARPGDLLMIDEPELNLHPRNQRRIARLFARLVNLGIKVFMTTHSDYIVKELNTLIMLSQDKPHLKRLAKKEGYRPDELLSPEQIHVYIAERATDAKETVGERDHILVRAPVDSELGIEARSFDNTINEMNEIQDAILWGDDG